MSKKFVLFLIPFILYIGLLSVIPLQEPDETRYSLIPSAMNESGNYVTPQIKHTVYLEKPPLVYWATAVSFKIFGENDFSARLFAALCAWGCILLVYVMGRHFRDEKTGLYAAMLLTVSLFPFIIGHINILDMPLAFFIGLSTWMGYRALKTQKKYFYYLLYFFCALAFLTKGIIGIVFPFGILVIWLLWVGRWREIWYLFSPLGILIFLVTVGPWLIMAQKENADFLWFFFVREHFLRFTTKMHGKAEPFYFYLPILVGGLFPWLFYLIRAWRNKYVTQSLFESEDNKFLIVWFVLIFIFYQVSSSKLAPYVLPLFLPMVLFAARIFRNYEEDNALRENAWQMRVYRFVLVLQSLVLFIAMLVPPFLRPYSDAENNLIVMVSGQWWLYIALPVMVLFLMPFLPDLIHRRFRKGWFLTIYILSAIFLGAILLPLNDFLAPYRSAKIAREAIAKHVPHDRDLYQYRINFYGIDFYNKIRTPIVEDFGELLDGIVKLPQDEKKRYFLYLDEFFALCENQKDVYCITQHNKKLKQIMERFPETKILWNNKAFYLLLIKGKGISDDNKK